MEQERFSVNAVGSLQEKVGETMVGSIDHIAFSVEDLASILDTMRGRGVFFLWDRIIPGSRGSQVAFNQSGEFNGVYMELVQR